ncbi:MAG: CtsR family transcriptional regulator [Clostridia bacterium]|nr:CtsR family transcriptional regulator [Clostridia bacterium]
MKTSDLISEFILKMLDEADGDLELKRNELAQQFGVVPSQINYVISSRFTPEQGFKIESRRGGGGYIKITRVTFADERYRQLMHVVNGIGNELSQFEAFLFLQNLESYGFIDKKTHVLARAAVSDKTLSAVPPAVRDSVRAAITKSMLMA